MYAKLVNNTEKPTSTTTTVNSTTVAMRRRRRCRATTTRAGDACCSRHIQTERHIQTQRDRHVHRQSRVVWENVRKKHYRKISSFAVRLTPIDEHTRVERPRGERATDAAQARATLTHTALRDRQCCCCCCCCCCYLSSQSTAESTLPLSSMMISRHWRCRARWQTRAATATTVRTTHEK